jgi:hypothetical protein
VDLSFQTPWSIVLLLVAVSFTVSWYLYHHTVPQVSAAQRAVLIFLRGTALSLLLLAVCEPLFQWTDAEERRPVIAVLADNSLSMMQQDGAGDRAALLAGLLRSDAARRLTSAAEVRYFSFSHSVAPLTPESLSMNGGTTNISGALQTMLRTIDDLQGIVLVSDGNYNAGTNPLYDAEKSRVPFFTVGIGDTSEQKDIAVSRLIANSIGYVDAALPVDVTVKASGIPPRQVTVQLTEDGKKIDERTIAVPSSGITELPVQFSYTPVSEGTKKLTVSVSAVEGELTAKNNSRSVLVKILKNKMSIVIIAGSVGPDVAAVMQTLDADANIDAKLFYQLPNGTFRSRAKEQQLQPSITSADAVVMIGFPTAFTSAASIDMVRQTIASRSVSVLFLAGRQLDLPKVRSLEGLFPFTVVSERMDEQMVLPSVAAAFRSHQLLQNAAGTWEKLPPLFYSLPTFGAKTESQSMVAVKMQNVPLNNPLFLVRNVGNAKSAAVLGYGLHRWKVMAGAAEETDGFFAAWFSSLIRWLATREQDKFLRIEPSKPFFSQGERILFTGQAYNESYQPVDDAEIQITLRPLNGAERYETAMDALGSGLYEAAMDGLAEGEYRYAASALRDGDTLGTASGRISVGEQSIEFAETKMNKPLLQQLAGSSGGRYVDVSAFDAQVDHILERPEMKSQHRIRTSEVQLWTKPSFLALIVLLFGIEWLIRKQRGML